ncbi:serine hydrolase domain-containing protein [Nocardia sp. NPDC051990]|uniref:serine hydrolase domain-containing protein n=1 Tax=Nocardia sp. NPDC051990 TaxID=3155285 RepID=UPI00344915E6
MIQNLLDDLVDSGREIGIQVAAYVHGRLALEAHAGSADTATGWMVDQTTLFPSYSTGKGIAALVVAVLVDRGVLDYAAPVVEYWPEFGTHGKESITVGQVLTHRAGLASLPADLSVEQFSDAAAVTNWLAEQRPEWKPGTATGYHGWTYGHLVAEIVRRATDRAIDAVLDDIANPLGIADQLYFALPDGARAATLYDGNWSTILDYMPPAFHRVAPAAVAPTADFANRPEIRRLAVPAAATITARGAARLYAAAISGELLSPATLHEATTLRTDAIDRVLGGPIRKAHGFFLGGPGSPTGTNPTIFGHNGSGGSIAYADPEHGLALAVTHNRLAAGPQDSVARVVATARHELGLGDFVAVG